MLKASMIVVVALLGSAQAAEPTGQRLSTGWEYYQGSLGSTWEVWRGEAATDNVTWNTVTLPHCFNGRDSVDPDVRYYQGPGWYRTKLKINNPYPNGRTVLHFDGAGQKSQVFVYTQKVGEHLGGYDQWEVDITDAAAKALTRKGANGEVPIAVLCDNSREAESVPSDLSDFNRYGGLYRHVYLKYLPAVSLERVHALPVLANGQANVKVRARLGNPTGLKDQVELALEVTDASGKVVASKSSKVAAWSGEVEVASFDISQPLLWSPKTPNLYKLKAVIKSAHGEQVVNERFGVRSTEWVANGPFKLNGERLLLKGTHYHEDHAGVAAAVPDEEVRKTMQMIKDMGANFIRLGHYQQAPLVLELCDELGILAWEEIPWCRGGLGGDRYKQQCLDMQKAMIDQHMNHAAIIMWGLGNENDWPGDFEVQDKEAIKAFMSVLNKQSHELDPSRVTTIRRCDFCKDIVDVYSPSIWAGWYSGRYTEYKDSVDGWMKKVKHFFHAEWGGDNHARRFAEDPESMVEKIEVGQGTAEKGKAYKASSGGKIRMSKDGDWSESYMANLFDWHLKEQETMPNLTGSAQWIFKDFATPLRPENPVPRVNQKGLIERDGTPKESYYIFQSYWSDKPMVRLFGHEWQTRWGKAGEAKEIRVYSNCAQVELFVNGKSAGVKKRNSQDYPAAGLRWNVVLNEGANQLKAVAVAEKISDEISVGYQSAAWGAPAKLVLKEIARKDGIVTLEARIYDTAGVACLDAATLVRFGNTGDARLIDNLGTSTGSRAVQLYNGRAIISAELTGPNAYFSVSAQALASQGLETQYLFVKNDKK